MPERGIDRCDVAHGSASIGTSYTMRPRRPAAPGAPHPGAALRSPGWQARWAMVFLGRASGVIPAGGFSMPRFGRCNCRLSDQFGRYRRSRCAGRVRPGGTAGRVTRRRFEQSHAPHRDETRPVEGQCRPARVRVRRGEQAGPREERRCDRIEDGPRRVDAGWVDRSPARGRGSCRPVSHRRRVLQWRQHALRCAQAAVVEGIGLLEGVGMDAQLAVRGSSTRP